MERSYLRVMCDAGLNCVKDAIKNGSIEDLKEAKAFLENLAEDIQSFIEDPEGD